MNGIHFPKRLAMVGPIISFLYEIDIQPKVRGGLMGIEISRSDNKLALNYSHILFYVSSLKFNIELNSLIGFFVLHYKINYHKSSVFPIVLHKS